MGLALAVAALLSVFVVNAGAASGDIYTWTGGGPNGNWTDPANWACLGTGCVSGSSTPVSDQPSDVRFPASVSSGVYAPVLNTLASAPVHVNSLTIYSNQYTMGGTGSLTVDGTSILTGTIGNSGAQTYSGAVTVTNNGLTIQNSTGVTFGSTVDPNGGNTAAALELFAPTTFDGNVGATQPFLSLGTKAVTIGAGTSQIDAGTINFGGNVSLTTSTTISAVSGAVSFFDKVDGASALTVSGGSAVFDGDVGDTTPLTALQVNAPLTMGASAITTTGTQTYEAMSAGTATLQGSAVAFNAAVTEQSTKTLTIKGPATFGYGASGFGNLIVNGDLTIGGGTFVAPPSGSTFDVGGNLSTTGGGTFNNNNGTVTFTGTGKLLSSVPFSGLDVASGATLDLNGFNETAATLTGSGTITNNSTSGPVSFTVSPTSADSFSGTITNATNTLALTKGGSGTLTLSGQLTYTGPTTISSGTMDLATGSTTLAGTLGGSGQLTVGSGTNLTLANSFGLTGKVTDNGRLTFDSSNPSTYSGSISGSGGISQLGTGILQLKGANTYTGTTVIGGLAPGDDLVLGAGGSLASTGAVTVGSSDVFDTSAGPQTIGDLSGTGTVRLGTSSLILGTANSTAFQGIFQGSGRLTKQGSGTLTLSGDSSGTYSGPWSVLGGLVDFSSPNNFGSATPGITLNGGGLQWAASYAGADITSRLEPLGASGGTLDTNGNSEALTAPLTGTGSLTKLGGGTLTLAGDNTYPGATNVDGGTLDVPSGSTISGTLNVGSAAAATVEGTVTGPTTVNHGSLTCQGGTLSAGPVANSGGTLTGAPGAPTLDSVTQGNGQATVSFTPNPQANCLPLGNYVVTASPGGLTASGSASPINIKGLTDGIPYTFTVTETNPVGGTPSLPSSAVTPNGSGPAAAISSPLSGGTYVQGQRIPTHFTCADASDGPGLRSCADSNGTAGAVSGLHAAGAGLLNTSTLGQHTYTVTATSTDGKRSTATLTYSVVLPPNTFTIKPGWPHAKYVNSCGVAKLKLGLPWAGTVNVLEKAPLADFVGSHKKGTFTFGKKSATVAAPQTLSLTIKPTAKGRRLIKHHRRRIVLTLKVSFTPRGGLKHTMVLKGIRVSGACRKPS